MSGTAIGIDLGTTNSCVAVFRNGKVEIIANEFGYRITPSYVSFNKDEQRVIGDSAKNKLLTNEKNTIFNTKRLLGRSWYDKVVQSQIRNYPFTVIKKKSRPHIVIEAKKGVRTFSVEQISAMILKRMVKIASEYLNEKIRNVVITVPAYFNDAQRDATKNAGLIAGLNILRIINEPTAAALAYGFDKMNQNKTILVFDLGGGTLDVSILKIENNTFTVLATSGNTYLGGEDFDQNVIDYYIKFYQMKYKKDFTKDPQAVQKLRKACEIAKKELTFAVSSEIVIESFFEGETFFETLSRTKFEELNKESFSSTMRPVKKALDGAKLKKSDINEVLMVGGSSRIPKIQELLTKFFNGKKPFQDINPDEAIAYGAAIEAARVSGQESSVILHDVNPLSLGVKDYSQKMLVFIPRNTRVPTKAKKILTTVIDYQESVSFSIYEGELPVATDNLFLGEFTLTNIQKALAAVPTLETTFEIDDNGILNVSAVDVVTNERKEIAVDYCKNRPTTKELEEMIKIAEKYDEIEEKYNESISLRIEFHDALYTLKSRVDGDKKLTNSNKAIVEKFIEENLCWLNENKICEIAEYKERKDELDAIVHNYFK